MKVEKQNICKKVLNQHWQGAYSLLNEQTHSNSQSKASKAKRKIDNLRQIGHHFISYLLSDIQESVVEKVEKAFSTACENKGVDTIYLLGFAIKQQINKSITNVVQPKLSEIISSNNESISHISLDDEDLEQDISIIFPNNYAKSKGENETRDFDEDDDDIVIKGIENSEINYNNDEIENENPDVQEYLNKLSKSTTQLSYLCQIMKLQQPIFEEGISKFNEVLFSCQAKIFIRERVEGKESANGRQLVGDCPGASSKKEAKRIASLFVLRKIYNRLPDLWIKFKDYRQKHPEIQQALNASNEEVFKKLKLYRIDKLTVFEDKTNENEKNKKIINEYLEEVKSKKAEMNLLLGRFKKISNLEFIRDKQDELSLWPVSASVYDGEKKIDASSREASKKVAEENCCKMLLLQIYINDIKRWEQFSQYKKQKALST